MSGTENAKNNLVSNDAAIVNKPVRDINTYHIASIPLSTRAAPNIIIRSALFGTLSREHGKTDELLEKIVIASQSNYQILFSGRLLDQLDLDIYLQCLFYCLQSADGKAHFTASDMLIALGKKIGGDNVRLVQDRLEKMVFTYLELQRKAKGKGKSKEPRWKSWHGNLLKFTEDSTGKLCVTIDLEFILWLETDYTAIDWKSRLSLKTSLAKWLHGYLSSHEIDRDNPERNALFVQTYYKFSGSMNNDMHSYRSHLKRSVEKLVEIGFVEPETWGVTKDDKLIVVKSSNRQIGLELLQPKKKKTKTETPSSDVIPLQPGFDLFGMPILPETIRENEKRIVLDIYPPKFEAVWAIYPKRAGSNPKGSAYEQWNQRICTGLKGDTAETIMAGLQRYIDYCVAKKQIDTEFVLQAKTFFGRSRRYAEEWSIGRVTAGKSRSVDVHSNIDDTVWTPGGAI